MKEVRGCRQTDASGIRDESQTCRNAVRVSGPVGVRRDVYVHSEFVACGLESLPVLVGVGLSMGSPFRHAYFTMSECRGGEGTPSSELKCNVPTRARRSA